jgi:uncharacterized protein
LFVSNLLLFTVRIVYDADKLDALGAISIGRTFTYGGTVGRPMHDPDVQATLHDSFEDYKANGNNSTINHFHEKLLLLKDRMFTKTGQAIARHRHDVIQQFVDEFYAEWDGKR